MPDNQGIVDNLLGGIKDPKLVTILETIANDLYGLNRQVNPPTTLVSVDLASGGNVVSVTAPTNFKATIFENDIRLSWTAPGPDTFLYEIRLGSVYASATILLTTATLSADIDPVSRFILTGTTYTFWITTIDNLGNHSAAASVIVPIPNI